MTKRAVFQLEPLTCPTCIEKIEKVVGRLDGVIDVKVFFHSSKVRVTLDESVITPEEVGRLITDLGYPVVA